MDTARPINGWPGYSVTSCGRILGPRGEKKQSTLKHGHKYVSFWEEGKTHKKYVHRLVAEAFLGPIPSGMYVCHNDGDPANNDLSNLRMDSQVGNMADTVKHGTNPAGARNGHAKLTPEAVLEIRTKAGSYRGVQRDLAEKFGVSQTTISEVIHAKVWH